jgi:hypothetical protein
MTRYVNRCKYMAIYDLLTSSFLGSGMTSQKNHMKNQKSELDLESSESKVSEYQRLTVLVSGLGTEKPWGKVQDAFWKFVEVLNKENSYDGEDLASKRISQVRWDNNFVGCRVLLNPEVSLRARFLEAWEKTGVKDTWGTSVLNSIGIEDGFLCVHLGSLNYDPAKKEDAKN